MYAAEIWTQDNRIPYKYSTNWATEKSLTQITIVQATVYLTT